MTFGGALYSSAMTVNAGSGAYGIGLNNGGTVTNAVVFANTGTLGIGSGFGFTGGVTATAPSGVSVAGTVTAAGTGVLNFAAAGVSVTGTTTIGGSSTGQISLGPTSIASGATLTLGTGINNAVSVNTITGAEPAA